MAAQKPQDAWITLPGDAWWWPDDYDYEKYGWGLDEDQNGAKSAFILLTTPWKEVPKEFDSILPSETILTMQDSDSNPNMYLEMDID